MAATVLVLEESSAVQELIDQALRASGHNVLSTKYAVEALEVVRRLGVDIVVVGSLHDGGTLVRQLLSVQPELRIVNICDSSGPFPLDDLIEAIDNDG